MKKVYSITEWNDGGMYDRGNQVGHVAAKSAAKAREKTGYYGGHYSFLEMTVDEYKRKKKAALEEFNNLWNLTYK